jgi:vWA found in TerF C terminus
MSIFDLQKRSEQIQFNLEKRGIKQAPVVRVGAAFDVSGSAQWMFTDGTIQKTIDRLVPLAMKFDDNGELDCWAFSHDSYALPSLTKHDYEGYVKREILDKSFPGKWGGTNYSPVMQAMIQRYFYTGAVQSTKNFLGGLFGSKKENTPQPENQPPALGLFITDGANSDVRQAAETLRHAQTKDIYWQLIGVGNPSEFGFLKQMADELPNVGFINLASLNVTDEVLYGELISDELCDWIRP